MSRSAVYRAVGLAAGLAVAALVAQALIVLLLVVAITILLSVPLAAAADLAERHRLPRGIGVIAALLLAVGVIAGLGYLLIPEFVEEANQFANRLPALLGSVQRGLHLHGAKLSDELSNFLRGYTNDPQRLIAPLEQIGGTVALLVGASVLIVFTSATIALNPGALVEALLRLLPYGQRLRARGILQQIRTAWLGWMTAMAVDMVVLGTLLFAGMALVGLPFALGFAVFSAAMTVIPNYGSIVSAIPPILAALSQSTGQAILVLLVYIVVNQIEGNLILPLVMARTVDMHPAVVALGLLVMGSLFGLIGIFIAIPLLSLAIILVRALWIEPQEAAAYEIKAPGG